MFLKVPPIPKTKFFRIYCLFSIGLLGAYLRLYGLAKESIWIDESISIRVASRSSLIQIAKARITDLPLYHLILHPWIELFGNSEFSVRFPSVIFGVLILLMVYKIGALVFDCETGLLGSLFAALSVFYIQYSQEARMYSLLALLTALSFYFFIKIIKERNFRPAIPYIVSSLALIATHFFGILIILSQSVYIGSLFLLSKDSSAKYIKKCFKLQVILFLLAIPALFLFFKWFCMIKTFQYWWIPKPSLISIAVSLLEYSNSPFLLSIFAVFLFLSFLTIRKVTHGSNNPEAFFEKIESFECSLKFSDLKNAYVFLVWLGIPILLLYFISITLFPVYWTRYTIGCALPFYLLAAKGISSISNVRIKSLIILLISLLLLSNLPPYYQETHKENWREAAKHIDMQAEPNDLVIFNPGTGQVPFNYYSKNNKLKKKKFMEMHEITDQDNIKKIEELTNGRDRIWVVLSHNQDPHGLLKDYFSKNFSLLYYKGYIRSKVVNLKLDGVLNKEVLGIEVFLFSRKK